MTTLQNSVCPHCGAALHFAANTRIVHCDFCDADIIVEQNQMPVQQQYMNPNFPPPEFVSRNAVPPQPYQNFPPGTLFDEAAFLKWKKRYRGCHILLSLLVIAFIMLLDFDDIALLVFLGIISIFFITPAVFASTKPAEPDASKNRKGWNIFKYYLLFVVNIVASFFVGAIIAGIFGLV